MTMTFEIQAIEMMAAKRSTPTTVEALSIQACVGIGTGLAYHHAGNDPLNGYVLTHIASGARVGAGMDDDVDTEEEARRWLELCAPLADWKSDLKELALTLNRVAVKEGVHQADLFRLASEASAHDCTIDTFVCKLVRAYLRDEVEMEEKEQTP
ncbi:MAG TPA: hypothetical protein VKR06_46095 [Ktedonosporobacter sp.]|nr:hypothetical protein [Ktedonosporobacter sp.]